MSKVRLQTVVPSYIEKRLKDEAERRETSVSALLCLAAEQFLATTQARKIPPLPVKSVGTVPPLPQEIIDLKLALAALQIQMASLAPAAPEPQISIQRPAALHIHARTSRG